MIIEPIVEMSLGEARDLYSELCKQDKEEHLTILMELRSIIPTMLRDLYIKEMRGK